MEKTLEQDTMFEIKINTLKSEYSDKLFITIHQDGKTIFLEHAKIVEFLKTIYTFK